jgi:hypothetical protein
MLHARCFALHFNQLNPFLEVAENPPYFGTSRACRKLRSFRGLASRTTTDREILLSPQIDGLPQRLEMHQAKIEPFESDMLAVDADRQSAVVPRREERGMVGVALLRRSSPATCSRA